MDEHPNISRLRMGYEAFAKGDMATLKDLYFQDIVWHWSGKGPLCGDHKGRDTVFKVFERMAQLSPDFQVQVLDILANDEHGVGLTRSVGSRSGKKLNILSVETFRMKGGRIIEFWSFVEDQRDEDDFWS